MPRFQKTFNALEAANILTNFDEDFDASFLNGVASKLGVHASQTTFQDESGSHELSPVYGSRNALLIPYT